MAGEKVLIIDPEREDVHSLIEELLYPEGYIVVHALDGEEGLRQALDGNPDLIIAEFATPRRPGLDVLARLRQSKREVPFILTGVSGSAETFKRALRMGVVDYLLKPLEIEEARAAIARALVQKPPSLPPRETSLLARGFEQINRQLEKRVRELSILHGIGKAVASVRDLEKLLNRIVEAAVYLTGAEEGFLLLIDEETDELYMRAGQGLGKKFATGFRLKSEDNLSWQVVRTGKPIMISSVADEERFKLKTGYLVKALLHVPLKLRGEAIGVLSVDNKIARRSFTDDDLHLLSALADYAAIAIDNVRQYERAEAEAGRYAELLSTRAPQPALPPLPVEDVPPVEAVPLDWLVQELRTQQDTAREGLKETEKLARDLTTQVSAVKQLAEWWRDQQVECEELTRRLASAEMAGAARSVGAQPPALPNLQGILDSLSEGILFTDRHGVVSLVNRTAAQLMGPAQVVGRDLRLISVAPHWVRSVDRLRNHRTPDKALWQEATFWNNGRLIKVRFLPLSEQGERDGEWAVILRDLSCTRTVRSAREDLTSVVAQELRTPMTILTSYTDLLLAEVLGLLVPVQQRLLAVMRANLTRMSGTLNNLMTVLPLTLKEEEGSLAVDLSKVIEETLTEAAPEFKDKGLHIELDMAKGLPQAAADPDCVYQMVTSLLQNAVRATAPGGTVTVCAEVGKDGLEEQPSHLVISVQDQGGGIAPEFLSQVFEHFYSEEDRPIPGLGGRGVELSLVKKLVEVFGGRVWVETEPGKGATFTLVLPATGG
jgi:signal transduction histidine kinase/DNA-binding response OmpR family regulator